MQTKSKGVIMSIHYCRLTYHNLWYSLLINLFIIYALLGNYFNIIFFTKKADLAFSIITVIVLAFFLFDFVIYLIGKKSTI